MFNCLLWSGHLAAPGRGTRQLAGAAYGHPLLSDPFNPMLIAPFAFGMLFAIWGKYIPVSDVLAAARDRGRLLAYDLGGWNVSGQYGFLYFLMWGAIRWTRLQHWEKFGDFSYGVYIFAWPLMHVRLLLRAAEGRHAGLLRGNRGGHPRDRLLQLAPGREAGHVAQGLVALGRARRGPSARYSPLSTARRSPHPAQQSPTTTQMTS